MHEVNGRQRAPDRPATHCNNDGHTCTHIFIDFIRLIPSNISWEAGHVCG